MKGGCIGRVLGAVLGIVLAAASPGVLAAPVQISYETQDLTDLVAGEDLWLYRYRVQGDFLQFSGFNVIFPATDYPAFGGIPVAPDPSWDLIVLPPEPAAGLEGIVSATAQTDSPVLGQPFEVTVVWAGAGTPGKQRFEVFDPNFQIIQSGLTVPLGANPVPEPASAWLVAGALGLLLVRRRRS